MKTTALAFVLLAAAGCTQATQIYRCGPGGREYSQTPCAGGTVLESSDPRSAAQRAEARRVAAQERKLAADLARERERDAAANPPALATGFNARPTPPEAASAAERGRSHKRYAKSKKRESSDFVAYEPRAAKAGRK